MARPRSHAGVLFPKLYFDMEPDEEEVRRDILLLKKKMGDYTLPLQYSKQIMIGDVTLAFTKQKDPVTGEPWRELSARAIKDRQKHGYPGPRPILRRSTRMYRALINRYNWGVTKEGVYLNQSRLPRNEEGQSYFVFHQQDDSSGTQVDETSAAFKNAATKRFVELSKTRAYEGQPNRGMLLAAEAKKQTRTKLLLGDENLQLGNIPRRRMVGPSPDAERQIVEVFDKWAKDVIIIYKRGRNIIVSSRRGMK